MFKEPTQTVEPSTGTSPTHSQGPLPHTAPGTGVSASEPHPPRNPWANQAVGVQAPRAARNLSDVADSRPRPFWSHSPQPSKLPPRRSCIRMIPPPYSINTARDRTHTSQEKRTRVSEGLRPPASTHPRAQAQATASSQRDSSSATGFSWPAHLPRGHAPQSYWPGGPDPCPAPRAAAPPPPRRHWRGPPPSSSHWSVCPPAVTAPRARGTAPER